MYTESQRKAALDCLAECGGNYRAASRLSGIPWTTLRAWQERASEEAASEANARSLLPAPPPPATASATAVATTAAAAAQRRLTDRLEEKIDEVMNALTPERIAAAPLGQLATTLGTLVDRLQLLRRAVTLTPEEMNAERLRLGEIICRYVTDEDILDAIATDMEAVPGPGPL